MTAKGASRRSRLWKLTSSALLFLTVIAVMMIVRNPRNHDILSIYDSVPLLAWMFLVVSCIGGLLIAVLAIFSDTRPRSSWQLRVGIFIVMLGNLVIVSLPYLLGYAYSECWDHLSYLGYSKDILNTGEIAPRDVYPVTHILIFALSSALGVTPDTFVNFIGPTFYALFVLFTAVLSKALLTRQAAILSVLSSTILFSLTYVTVFPMALSFMTFPLILFVYTARLERPSSRRQFTIIVLLMVTAMAFFHPVASAILAVAFLAMEIGKCLHRTTIWGGDNSSPLIRLYASGFSSNILIVSVGVLMLWIWNRSWVWRSSVDSAIGWFRLELLGPPLLSQAQESFSALGLTLVDQVWLTFLMFGHFMICLAISLGAIILIIGRRARSSQLSSEGVLMISSFFVLAATITLLDYVRPVTTLFSGRFTVLLSALFPPFVGLVLHEVALKRRPLTSRKRNRSLPRVGLRRYFPVALVSLMLVASSVVGIFAIYPSPLTLRPSLQVSHTDVAGENWLLTYGDSAMLVIGIGPSGYTLPERFAHAEYGTLFLDYPKWGGLAPDHFSYTSSQNLGESFEEDRYLTLTTRDRLLYTQLWPEVGRFDVQDFEGLEGDSSVMKICDDGGIDIWYVRGLI